MIELLALAVPALLMVFLLGMGRVEARLLTDDQAGTPADAVATATEGGSSHITPEPQPTVDPVGELVTAGTGASQ